MTSDPVLPFGLRGTARLGRTDLEPGDAVLLYTDGVTEARAADGELFGLDRLTDLLEQEAASERPPEEMLRRLVRALLEHQPEGLRDDATLLLVQWTGRPRVTICLGADENDHTAVIRRYWGRRNPMRTGTGESGPMVNDGPGADRGGQEDPVGAGRTGDAGRSSDDSGQSPDGSGRSPDDPGGPGGTPSRWSRWRGWRPWVKPVRRVVLLFIVALVVEYLVVPELVGARKDLYLLNQLNAGWAVAGVVVEVVSLFCYAVLTKVLLPPGPKPSLSRLFRIDLSAAAVAHVIPAGTLGTAALGFRLFTNEGISANDAGVMMAAKGLGSTIVLNVLLWLSLVISIPLAGFRPIYGTVAIIGTVLLAAVALVIIGVTRGTERASRILHWVGDKIPWVSGDRLEAAVRQASKTASNMAKDKRVLAWALVWAAVNWLLDAACLWCFIAALYPRYFDPVLLFAAYGSATSSPSSPSCPAGSAS